VQSTRSSRLFRATDLPPNRFEASKSHSALGWVGSSCDFNFELGRQYIIYARKTADGRWTTSLCSGTKLVEEAAEDLDYIATIPAAEATGRVYGSIERTAVNPRGVRGDARRLRSADLRRAVLPSPSGLVGTDTKHRAATASASRLSVARIRSLRILRTRSDGQLVEGAAIQGSKCRFAKARPEADLR
jgi:hypothetical protein